MMLPRRTHEVITLALTLALGAGGACARGRNSPTPPPPPVRPEAPAVGGGPREPGPAAAAPVEIRARLVRLVSNGCRYTGNVAGAVQASREAGAGLVYAPRLTVDAEVECGHGVLHDLAPTTVDGPRYTRDELEQALSEAGRVNVDTAGQLCTYWPEVRVQGEAVSLPSVREACRRDVPGAGAPTPRGARGPGR